MSLPPLFDNRFPCYYKEKYSCVNILWYQADFTQSKYPPGQEISEACTLICLLVAYRISQLDLLIGDIDGCQQFNIVIAKSIIEGNRIHMCIVDKKLVQNPYLNVEEALQFGGSKLSAIKEWKFQVFHEDLECSLFKNIRSFLCEWYKSPKSSNLFVLLITCGRTILFIFQQKTKKAIIFDSHGHNTKNTNRGLVVAQAPISSLEELCNWYIKDVIQNCYQVSPNQYELTCLYHQPEHKSDSCNRCQCGMSNKK
ncbi:uncharacterized protein LOC106647667 [Copidosoma floridanum]|uniref:uncharacterized protein LOC106647667 n=1 Tax=Copidosoma floridanum TaxID=29053 RepID=UPI0006C96E9D|nr:uncharacterized protein LOC106647667 [Copidosoma floridanum]